MTPMNGVDLTPIFLRIVYFQLTELTLADGSAGGQVKNDRRYSKQKQRQSFHQPPPFEFVPQTQVLALVRPHPRLLKLF